MPSLFPQCPQQLSPISGQCLVDARTLATGIGLAWHSIVPRVARDRRGSTAAFGPAFRAWFAAAGAA